MRPAWALSCGCELAGELDEDPPERRADLLERELADENREIAPSGISLAVFRGKTKIAGLGAARTPNVGQCETQGMLGVRTRSCSIRYGAWTLVASQPSDIPRLRWLYLFAALAACATGAAAGGWLGLWVARWATRPLRAIAERVHCVTPGKDVSLGLGSDCEEWGVCCIKQPPRCVRAGNPTPSGSASAGSEREQLLEGAAEGANAQPTEVNVPLLEGYALSMPSDRQELPKVLKEVSGLTDISDTEVACAQDEEGSVFIYDLAERRIKTQIPFGDPGDYEGITRVEDALFVLRSDGILFEIAGFASGAPKLSSTDLRMPTRDNEGLCYDPFASRLLVSPKNRLGKSDEERRAQGLFGYDLKTRRADTSPSVLLDLSDVLDGREKVRETKRGRKRVLPSSVTVHPKTGQYFVISAVAHNWAVFTRKGELVSQQPLEHELYPQPEGITFLPNHELVIVNEGVSGNATLIRIKPTS
ncbi:MAG TPA: hypothetical protein VKP30_24490 [Polyangiaceae bacterium]|nr:hypothetical protein [Polyangiaceae bacterium]